MIFPKTREIEEPCRETVRNDKKSRDSRQNRESWQVCVQLQMYVRKGHDAKNPQFLVFPLPPNLVLRVFVPLDQRSENAGSDPGATNSQLRLLHFQLFDWLKNSNYEPIVGVLRHMENSGPSLKIFRTKFSTSALYN